MMGHSELSKAAGFFSSTKLQIFLPLGFCSTSLPRSFLSGLLSPLLSEDGWTQELSTTFQSYPPGWKQISFSSSDISVVWVESEKPLKNQFISTTHPKVWKLFEDYPRPWGWAFLLSLWGFFLQNNSLSISSVFFHLSYATKTNLQLPPFLSFTFASRRNLGTLLLVFNTISCALPQREAILVKLLSRQNLIFQPPPQKPDQNNYW